MLAEWRADVVNGMEAASGHGKQATNKSNKHNTQQHIYIYIYIFLSLSLYIYIYIHITYIYIYIYITYGVVECHWLPDGGQDKRLVYAEVPQIRYILTQFALSAHMLPHLSHAATLQVIN